MFCLGRKFVSCLLCMIKVKKNPKNFFQKHSFFPALAKSGVKFCGGGQEAHTPPARLTAP